MRVEVLFGVLPASPGVRVLTGVAIRAWGVNVVAFVECGYLKLIESRCFAPGRVDLIAPEGARQQPNPEQYSADAHPPLSTVSDRDAMASAADGWPGEGPGTNANAP